MGNFNIMVLFWAGILVMFGIWGFWELIDWLFIEDVIKSKTLLVPEIRLVVKNNIVDTIYVYHKP